MSEFDEFNKWWAELIQATENREDATLYQLDAGATRPRIEAPPVETEISNSSGSE